MFARIEIEQGSQKRDKKHEKERKIPAGGGHQLQDEIGPCVLTVNLPRPPRPQVSEDLSEGIGTKSFCKHLTLGDGPYTYEAPREGHS